MGNVKSFCCKDNISEADEYDERARILANSNCGNSCDDIYNNSATPVQSPQDNVSYGSLNNGCDNKTIEQSILDKIYQRMASNLIDVAPGESMVIQSGEFTERQRAYQARLNQIKTPLPLKLGNRGSKHVNTSLDATLNISSISPSNLNVSSNSSGTRAGINLSHNQLSPIDTTRSNVASSPQEKRRVEYEPITDDEIRLISEISLESAQAIKNFKIETLEQVVVQFKP